MKLMSAWDVKMKNRQNNIYLDEHIISSGEPKTLSNPTVITDWRAETHTKLSEKQVRWGTKDAQQAAELLYQTDGQMDKVVWNQ